MTVFYSGGSSMNRPPTSRASQPFLIRLRMTLRAVGSEPRSPIMSAACTTSRPCSRHPRSRTFLAAVAQALWDDLSQFLNRALAGDRHQREHDVAERRWRWADCGVSGDNVQMTA